MFVDAYTARRDLRVRACLHRGSTALFQRKCTRNVWCQYSLNLKSAHAEIMNCLSQRIRLPKRLPRRARFRSFPQPLTNPLALPVQFHARAYVNLKCDWYDTECWDLALLTFAVEWHLRRGTVCSPFICCSSVALFRTLNEGTASALFEAIRACRRGGTPERYPAQELQNAMF